MNGYSKDFWSQPCDEWKDFLAAATSDDLSVAERQGLNNHLIGCRNCSTTLKEYQALDASLARFRARPLPGLPPQLLQLWERENQPGSILSPMAITMAAAAVFIPLVSVTVSIIIGGTLLTAVAIALALGGIAAAALTLKMGNTPYQQGIRPQSSFPFAGRKARGYAIGSLLLIIVILTVMLSIVFPSIQALFQPPQAPTHNNSGALPQLTSIGAVKTPGGEYVGISDGTFAFDTNRLDGALKLQAATKLKASDTGSTISLLQAAIAEDSNDAEALIYLEDQRVINSGDPYITIVIGSTLTGDANSLSVGRENLQGAYLVQYEYNVATRLPNREKVRLLIANSGSSSVYTTTVAKQIVQVAQRDKTIVGVMGWSLSAQSLNAVAILAAAKIPMVSTAGGDSLTGLSRYFFRVAAPAKDQARVAAQYAEQTLHAKTAAIFIDVANDYSRSLANDFQQAFSGPTVATEHYTIGDTKMLHALVQDALGKHPGVIYFAGYPKDVSVLLARLGPSDPPVLGGNALYELQGYSQEARTGLNHLRFTALAYPDEWDVLGLSARKPSFFDEYKMIYDPHSLHTSNPYGYDRPDSGVMLSYDATSVLLHAGSTALVAKSSIEGSDLQQALAEMTEDKALQGVTGQISFGPDGNPIDKAVTIVCVAHIGNNYFYKMDAVQGRFLVGEPIRMQFPASSVCS